MPNFSPFSPQKDNFRVVLHETNSLLDVSFAENEDKHDTV